MDRLKDRVALVTGGGAGIGAAIGRIFCSEGAAVVLVDQDGEALEAIVRAIKFGRSLARRLKVHHNTVSAAYQDLQAARLVDLRRGSGVYVRRAFPAGLTEARGLDDIIF